MKRSIKLFLVGCVVAIVFIIVNGCGTELHEQYVCLVEGNDCEKVDKRGEKGDKGDRGPAGPAGKDGVDGESCFVEQLENGAVIYCANTSAIIYNGAPGEQGEQGEAGYNGQDGQDAEPGAYTFTEVIDPCGKEGSFDEVIFRTYSNELVAHYSQGNKQFLTFITPGNYKTTDGTNCLFTVTSDMEVLW